MAALEAPDDTQRARCSRCTYEGPLHTFPLKKNLNGHVKICQKCMTYNDRAGKTARARKASDKENIDPHSGPAQESCTPILAPVEVVGGRHITMALHEAIDTITHLKTHAFKLDCIIFLSSEDLEDIGEEAGSALTGYAHAIARRIRVACGWRFK